MLSANAQKYRGCGAAQTSVSERSSAWYSSLAQFLISLSKNAWGPPGDPESLLLRIQSAAP